jgi:hypothetical protein
MKNTELIKRLRLGQTHDPDTGDLQDMTYIMDEAADALETAQTANETALWQFKALGNGQVPIVAASAWLELNRQVRDSLVASNNKDFT